MSKQNPAAFIALLRGINVGGHNLFPAPALKGLCGELGWGNVGVYIQSGNVVFTSAGEAAALELQLERAITRLLGREIPVVVRTATAWEAYVRSNPFPDASSKEPNLVMLALSKKAPRPDALAKLRERAHARERIEQIVDAFWVHFNAGVAKSKLGPALLDRFVGSPVTMRNWRTVQKLNEMASEVNPRQRA